MSERLPRGFEETPSGPVFPINAAAATVIAAALGQLLEARPQWAGPDRVLEQWRRHLVELVRLDAAGVGRLDTTDVTYPRGVLLTATQAARRAGVSPGAVQKRCRTGAYPGARLVDRRWLIPAEDIDPEET